MKYGTPISYQLYVVVVEILRQLRQYLKQFELSVDIIWMMQG